MPRGKPDDDLEKVTIRLKRGTCATLQCFFPHTPYNIIIRLILARYCRYLEEQLPQAKSISKLDLQEEEEIWSKNL